MQPLATIEDVQQAFGQEMTPEQKQRAEFVLAKLSAAFRARARQTFTVEQYTHRLKVNAGHVLTTRTPLVEVLSVFDDEGNEVPFETKRGYIRVPRTSEAFVNVTFVPDDVRLQIADSARRVLSISADAVAGIVQVTKSAGPFSETNQLASWAVGAQALLSPDDEALAASYRPRRAKNVWVMTP